MRLIEISYFRTHLFCLFSYVLWSKVMWRTHYHIFVIFWKWRILPDCLPFPCIFIFFWRGVAYISWSFRMCVGISTVVLNGVATDVSGTKACICPWRCLQSACGCDAKTWRHSVYIQWRCDLAVAVLTRSRYPQAGCARVLHVCVVVTLTLSNKI